MARLTQKERSAIMSAMAFFTAGEWDETTGPDPGFTLEDAESAHDKIAADYHRFKRRVRTQATSRRRA